MSGPPEIALFFGRLHVLLVHLPIVLILLLALLEWLSRSKRFSQANASAGLLLGLTVPAVIFTVICGLLLSLAGGYGQNLLQWHKWTGIATGVICLAAALLYRFGFKHAYRCCLTACVIVMAVTSHFGGSLTHGTDYLVKYAPPPLRNFFKPAAPAQTVQKRSGKAADPQVFADLVQPILQQNCVSCHGPEKSKAGLRLDSFEAVVKGGESGPAIVPGKSSEGPLLKRVRLPIESDDHMPPAGKPQPTAADLALLQWWIDSGAPKTKSVSQLKPSPQIARILQTRLGASSTTAAVKALPPKPLAQVLPLAESVAETLNVSVSQIAPNQPWLQCNASLLRTNFGDTQLAALAPLAANLKWLDLGGTAVTDAGLEQLARMPNLTRVHLEHTPISDAGLGRLAALSELEYLNLYGTAITDSGLETLQKLPKLKQVYLWQTKVTPETARTFAESRIDRDQVQQWQDEIENLKKQIQKAEFFVVDVGADMAASTSTNATPVNTQCPVSGKPIDPSKTLTYEGKLIAFCCDDCKAKFQQDPKPFLAKLETLMPKETKTEPKK